MWQQELLKKKGKLVVGGQSKLKRKIIEIFHSSEMGGHSGVQVTAKRV